MTFDYRKTQCFEVPYRDAFNRLFENAQFKQAVIVGADVILHSDFLHYIFEVSPVLHSLNSDVISVSGWNPNSFLGTSFPSESLFRIEEFPLYGWVLTREIKELLTKSKETFASCCGDRKWYEGWNKPDNKGVVVIPGVSRVSLAQVPEAFDLGTIKLMLYRNKRINSSTIINPFGKYRTPCDRLETGKVLIKYPSNSLCLFCNYFKRITFAFFACFSDFKTKSVTLWIWWMPFFNIFEVRWHVSLSKQWLLWLLIFAALLSIILPIAFPEMSFQKRLCE